MENIIFDLGGVMIDLQREKAVEALQKLGVENADRLLGEYEQKGIFYKLETGEITSSELYDALIPLCTPGTNCNDICNAFEEFLRDLPVERLEMLEKLKEKGYKLYVLSNTNPIMFNDWIAKAFQQQGKTINDYFNGVVLSFQEGVCKPDHEIFQRIISRYNLEPEQTIFLDDSQANVDSAKKAGINAVRIISGKEGNFMEECSKLL